MARSKTNQEGRLETVAVAYGSEPTTGAVRAVRRWIAADATAIDTSGHPYLQALVAESQL